MAVPEHDTANEIFDDVEIPDQRDPIDMMPNNTFSSSNVHSGLYDFSERELFMRYKRTAEPDALYQYRDVPAQTWSALVAANSKGTFINANVAYNYVYAKVGRDELPARNVIGSDLVRRFCYDP